MNEDSRILRPRLLCSEILALIDERIKKVTLKPSSIMISQVSYGDNISQGEGDEDELVAVDAAATAGYLGAAYNDGVLRTDTSGEYVDGGNFVTLTLTKAKVSTDDTTPNWLENKIVAGANVTVTTLNPGANETLSTAAGGIGAGFFGDGSDGDVVINIDAFLVRDMFYDDLTIDPGCTLSVNAFKIFVKGTLTNNGTISAAGPDGGNGGDAYGSTGGIAGTTSPVPINGSITSGVDGNDGGTGADGVANNNGTMGGPAGAGESRVSAFGNNGSQGANAGAGGDTVGHTGGASGSNGAGGTALAVTATCGGVRNITTITLWRVIENDGITSFLNYNAGSGGGAGGGSGGSDHFANKSGGGGGGGSAGAAGGAIYIAAFNIQNNGTITAAGGSGGQGGNGGDGEDSASETGGGGGGGGGAGGNGGVVVIIYGTGAIGVTDVTAGTGGSGGTGGSPGSGGGDPGGNGNSGDNGSAGEVITFTLVA